jgi:integrase/recombinase XerD
MDNPIARVDKPLTAKRILPAITFEQLEILLANSTCLRDKRILNLLFDSGLRVSEVASLRVSDLNLDDNTLITIIKGNRQAKACFTTRTASLLEEYLSTRDGQESLFGLETASIQTIQIGQVYCKNSLISDRCELK